jgi:toxin-antitoxin system PIN domain toxin
VIILDANILLYAYDSASPHHRGARAWIERVFSSSSPIGLPWQTISAFLRIMTHPKVPGARFSIAETVQIVDGWLEQPNIRPLGPGEDHWVSFRQAIIEGQALGPLITDAQLAALTIAHGGVLHTTDRDFSRFPGLRWKNPLE